mgnify:CR=1 FL=1
MSAPVDAGKSTARAVKWAIPMFGVAALALLAPLLSAVCPHDQDLSEAEASVAMGHPSQSQYRAVWSNGANHLTLRPPR